MTSTLPSVATPGGLTPPEGWVPVDRRWLGLDRATIRPALVVAVLAVIMMVLVPAIDRAVPGGTPIRSGDRVGLNGDVSFAPAAGLTLRDGALLGDASRSGGYPATAEVDRGALSLTVQTTKYDGTAAALLDQIRDTQAALGDRRRQVSGRTTPVVADDGTRGVQARYRSTSTDGLLAAYVFDGTGVAVVVSGPDTTSGTPSAEVATMIKSFAAKGAGR